MRWLLLAHVAAVVIPSMGLVAIGNPALGARCFFALLGAILGYHAIQKSPAGYAAVLIGVSPALLLFRQVWLYSIVVVLFGGGLGLWLLVQPQSILKLFKQNVLAAFLILSFLYWWISFVRTGDYSANLRVLELAFSAATAVLLGSRRSYLRAAIAGVGVTILITAMGLAPHSGMRLGQAEIGETSMGNPILIGLASALPVLMLLADRWEGIGSRSAAALRWVLLGGSAIVLVLSTSRGSWMVTIAGLAAMFAFTQRDRARIAGAVVAVMGVIALLVSAGMADSAIEYFDRATSSERSLVQKTTGRFDQWQKFPQAFAASPVWGHGPGSGGTSYTAVSGRELAWHSLYLHVGAETGLVGLFSLLTIIGLLLARGIRHASLTGDASPLVGAVCFAAIGLSVSGFDAVSGLYLGFGFLGMELTGIWAPRRTWRGSILQVRPAPSQITAPR